MATTRIMPFHAGKGRTESRAISDIINYVVNPQKTDNGRLITGFACDSRMVDAGFLLTKRQYIVATGRVQGRYENYIERGKEALASIGYSEATSMQLLPTVREYRNQTMLYLFLLRLFLFGMVYLVLLFYLRRQHRGYDVTIINSLHA